MFAARQILIAAAVAATTSLGSLAAQATETAFAATLDGAQNLPEPIKTSANGAMELHVSADGKTIAYKLTVHNLANPSAADVHLGSPTQNGPPVVKLWPHGSAAKKGDVDGVLAEGTFNAADLIGPLTGAPLSDLVEALESGNVYVNVHTNDGADPPNSGPGDFRLGEIRGQVTH